MWNKWTIEPLHLQNLQVLTWGRFCNNWFKINEPLWNKWTIEPLHLQNLQVLTWGRFCNNWFKIYYYSNLQVWAINSKTTIIKMSNLTCLIWPDMENALFLDWLLWRCARWAGSDTYAWYDGNSWRKKSQNIQKNDN